MTRFLLAATLLVGWGCADRGLAPNTDLGLLVWAEVEPASLSLRDSASEFVIRVNVYNPSGREIRVPNGGPARNFTNDPAKSVGLWGSIRIARDTNTLNAGPGSDSYSDSVYVVPARTTVTDERTLSLAGWRAGGWPLTPGTYTVRVWFHAREGTSADLTFVP